MRKWTDLTTAEIKRVMEGEGFALAGPQGTKAEFAAWAETVLGPDPDNPKLVNPAGALTVPAVPRAGLGVVVEDGDGRSIAQRMADVLADLPAIPKGEQAPGNMGGYRFRGIEQITAALSPLLAKHGVTMMPRVLQRIAGERPTGGGKVQHVVDLHVEFTFRGLLGDTVTGDMWGEGTDMGDKATQKAATAAWKSLLGPAFCISDPGTDAEAYDVPDTEAEPERVPDPVPDGFRSHDEAREATAATTARAADANIGAWVKDQGFGWPWSRAACDAIEAQAAKVLKEERESGVCIECGKADGGHADGCSRGPF